MYCKISIGKKVIFKLDAKYWLSSSTFKVLLEDGLRLFAGDCPLFEKFISTLGDLDFGTPPGIIATT